MSQSASSSNITTPALSIIGRKNSGKTTLLEKLIRYLTDQGLRVASIKHHGHPDFDIDIPGRDSFRHRMAGAQSSIVLSDVRFAQITELSTPLSCEDALVKLSNFDIALVEGFRQSALSHIELFRQANPRDQERVEASIRTWEEAQTHHLDTLPVALVSDMPTIIQAAEELGLPFFGFDDIEDIARFVTEQFARPKLSVVVQAGGESKRMGTPKEVVSFMGRPLIQAALDRVAALADELIVTTNDPARVLFLTDEYPALRFVSDALPKRGSVPGLYSALSAASHALVAVVACDMVDIPQRLIAEEALLLRPCITPSYDLIIPKTETGIEPFAAVYRKEPCLAAVQQLIQNDNARMSDLVDLVSCGYIDCSSSIKCARFGGSFLNANSLEDLQEAERLLTTAPDCLL